MFFDLFLAIARGQIASLAWELNGFYEVKQRKFRPKILNFQRYSFSCFTANIASNGHFHLEHFSRTIWITVFVFYFWIENFKVDSVVRSCLIDRVLVVWHRKVIFPNQTFKYKYQTKMCFSTHPCQLLALDLSWNAYFCTKWGFNEAKLGKWWQFCLKSPIFQKFYFFCFSANLTQKDLLLKLF